MEQFSVDKCLNYDQEMLVQRRCEPLQQQWQNVVRMKEGACREDGRGEARQRGAEGC